MRLNRISSPHAQSHKVHLIDRVVAILEAFSLERPEMGVAELSRATGISKATVHRILTALQTHRLVEQDPLTQRYRLGFRLFDLGTRVTARVDHIKRAQPYLEVLASDTRETVHLAVLDQGLTYYVAKVEGSHALRMPSQVGKRLPSHATGVGKALLAHLPEAALEAVITEHGLRQFTPNTITSLQLLRQELAIIRKRGYSVDDEEIEHGLRCIGAPIRDYTGNVVAAVSIAGPSTRLTLSAIPEFAEKIVGTAEAISRSLGAPELVPMLNESP